MKNMKKITAAFLTPILLLFMFIPLQTALAENFTCISKSAETTTADIKVGGDNISNYEVRISESAIRKDIPIVIIVPESATSDGDNKMTYYFTKLKQLTTYNVVVVDNQNQIIEELKDCAFTTKGTKPDTIAGGGVKPDTIAGGGKGASDGVKVVSGIKNPLGSDLNDIPSFIKEIINVVLLIGIPIVVLAIIYCGFLFVTASGNSEKLKKAKQALLYTLIGAALLLGSFVIANAIQGTVEDIVSTT